MHKKNHIQSAAVAETLYDIEWYKCDVQTRKMILMMLRRSQKATTISVPFFTPSLTAFSSVSKRRYKKLKAKYQKTTIILLVATSCFHYNCQRQYQLQQQHYNFYNSNTDHIISIIVVDMMLIMLSGLNGFFFCLK